MRNNQLGLTLLRFPEAGDAEVSCVHVYSDSNEAWLALGNAFAAATMWVCGRGGAPEFRGGRCDVASTDDADEGKRAFARMVAVMAERRDPVAAGCRGRGLWYARARLQRFPKVVSDYLAEEQVIGVAATSADVHALLSAVYVELASRVRGHDALVVLVDVRVRTNADAQDPLVGALEHMRRCGAVPGGGGVDGG